MIVYLQDGIVKDGLWDVYNQIHMVGIVSVFVITGR